MINFIFGRTKSGKTTEVLNRIKREVENGNGECVLLVPEQTTFEYEKALLHVLGDGNFTSVPVLSFTRLTNEVSRLSGGKSGKQIDDAKRTVLMSRALFSSKDKLKVFSKYVSNISFVRNIINTVSELKRCGIESDDIKKCVEKLGDGALSRKLNDIDIISTTYSGLIKNTYIDPEDDMAYLAKQLSEYAYFAGKTVFVDAFKNFTGAQMRVLSEIIRQSDETVFSFCFAPESDDETGLFSVVSNTIKQIKRIAQNYDTAISSNVLSENFYKSEELKFLECSLANNVSQVYDKETENIVLASAATIYDETEYAAREIRRLVREENYRYRDFAVICRSDEQYRSAVEHTFNKYDIPCFTDKRYSVSFMPISVFVTASLTAASTFDSESILKYLKTELCDVTFDEISMLENYVYIWDINRNDWKNDWTMSPSGFEKFDDADKLELEKINAIRKKAILPLLKLREETEKENAISSAVWQHINRLNVGEKLANLAKELNALDAALLPQAWDAVISILDGLYDTLSDCAFSVDEYITYFRIAAENAEIGVIPQMVDEVQFGAADRIKPQKPKIVFLLGANQGVFPAQSAPTGIIGGVERNRLLTLGLPIKDYGLEFAAEEQYLVYTTLCCATERLYMTYSQTDAAGKEAKPSSAFITVGKMFEKCKTAHINRETFGAENIETPAAAFTGLLRNFDNSALKDALCDIFSTMPQYSERLETVLKSGAPTHLSPETSERLYGKNMRLSATGVDTFFRCSFSYFCRYGLRAKVMKKAEIDVLQRGTIVHEVLEKLIKKYKSDYKNLTDEQINNETEIIVEEYLERIQGIEKVRDNRFMHLVSTIKKLTKEVAIHIRNDFAQSGFEPVFCELKIGGYESDIESAVIKTEKGSVAIHGAIDRVDEFGAYIRVVDYKTGSRKFNLSDVLFGLNMQMLIYLYAVMHSERFENKTPAGVLYLETGKKVDEEYNFVMNGLLSQNVELHDAMDKENNGRFIPKLRTKKDGSFYKSKDYIEEKDFETIFAHVERMLKKMNTSLLSGELVVNPTDEREKDACKYCDFASVCKIENRAHKKVPPMDNETVTTRMGEEAFV